MNPSLPTAIGGSTEAEKIAAKLTPNQRRILLAMRVKGPKKWRAVYRHAKVTGWTQLPFKLAHPTLDGREVMTPLGLAVRAVLLS
jgi:hypothetical protein